MVGLLAQLDEYMRMPGQVGSPTDVRCKLTVFVFPAAFRLVPAGMSLSAFYLRSTVVVQMKDGPFLTGQGRPSGYFLLLQMMHDKYWSRWRLHVMFVLRPQRSVHSAK
jgi:hypothetical protein